MKTKKILIAYESDLIINMLKNFLEEQKYHVIFSKDGIEALKKTFKEQPDCLIISNELPIINGYNLTHIIKTNKTLKNTAVIISSSEQENDEKFWANNAKCDAFYIPSSENLLSLATLIENKISRYNNKTKSPSKEIDDKEIIQLVSSAFGEELFELYMIKDAYNIENYIWDFEHLLTQLARSINNIYNYDVLGIIVNEDKIDEFYDRSDSIVKNDFLDFRSICQNDFSKRIRSRQDYNWQNSNLIESVIEQFNYKKEKLKNYNIFPMDPSKKYPFTIHIATTAQNSMNSIIQKRLDFLTDIYSPIFEKFITYNKSLKNEYKIINAFSRYLPPTVIEGIIEGDSSLTSSIGRQKNVAILVMGIRDFSAITEINSPDILVAFLNQYFTLMDKIILKHGGTIDKLLGDKIIALFGAPEDYKYNAYRATNAAVEMLKEVEKFDTSILSLPKDFSFNVGIGIHYGHPIVGAIGSNEKKEYTVIGEDINLTTRIESLTKLYGSSILITDSVKKDIEAAESDNEFGRYLSNHESYFTRYLDNVKVKGKKSCLQFYELYYDENKYSSNFINNFSKGLYQYLVGNFNGAQDYLRIAKVLAPNDKTTVILLERCKKYIKKQPQNWDGAITLTIK